MSSASRAERLAVVAIVALTLWRLAWLPAASLDLYVDEAQYWLWGREMAAGAYSKPPLVGWLIRAATEIAGSDAPWVVRAPWPLVHGAAALAVMALGRRVAGPAVAALAGLSYATMPAVSLGSVLVTTDSPMLLALAVSLWLWHRQAAGAAADAGVAHAVALGLAIGAGLWAKYAMLFALAGLALAAVADRGWRLRGRDAGVALSVATAVIAPNLWWNLQHGMATLRHTAAIADAAPGLDWAGLAGFAASQFVVAGPLVFAGLLAGWSGRRVPGGLRGLLVVATVILGIVMAQALRGGANANWAVGAYVPGAVVASAWLARRRWRAVASLAIGGTLALALPLLATQAERLRLPGGELLMARYVGQAQVSAWAIGAARRTAGRGPVLMLATERALLADLTYRARRRGGAGDVTVRALPPAGWPRSHYELVYPLRGEAGPAFWLGEAEDLPACARPLDRLTPDSGEWAGTTLLLAAVPPACLDSLRGR